MSLILIKTIIMYKDFIEELNKKYKCNGEEDLEGLDLQHYRFAASSNSRGRDAIQVFEAYGFKLDGLRILDVGCAYGGFSVEAAKKGAKCYGVEIMEWLYDMAVLNNMDEEYDKGSCQFELMDATSSDFLEKLPHEYFDLIIINDVFEHVYDTVLLMNNISKVANEKCSLYYVIPNGNDLRFVAKEGHTGLPGISMVSPLFWHTIAEKIYSIYYRQFEYYEAIFAYYGFKKNVPVNKRYDTVYEDMRSRLDDAYQEMSGFLKSSEESFTERYKKEIGRVREQFDKQLNYDLRYLEPCEVSWKYLTKFWAGFAHRADIDLEPLLKTTASRSASDKNDDIHFELERVGNKLRVAVDCSFPTSGYDYAYHLMIRDTSIERSRYIKETEYEWELKSPALYGVAIYVKHKDSEHKDWRILTNHLYYPGEK